MHSIRMVLGVLVGFALGRGGLGLVHLDPGSGFVATVAVVALVVILFRDGLEVEAEMLWTAWAPPLRKLALGMPITAGIVALGTHTIVGLDWTRSFLVGALLSPTDPVLSSGVVTNPRVPRLVRHSLNLESGLNDGLALPPVLALAAALEVDRHHFTWWTFVLQDVGLGLAFGIAAGLVAAWLMPARHRVPYAAFVAGATYAVTVAPPHGNGLIAVFVCAIVLAVRHPELPRAFELRADRLVGVVKVGIFVVFGALLTTGGLFHDGWAAVALVAVTLLVARPAALAFSLAGTGLGIDVKAFMAWFGPKGVATMTYALLVLGKHIPGNTRIFDLAALTVVCSIVAHGLSDAPGAEWLARRRDPEGAATREGGPAPARTGTSTLPAPGAPDGT